MQSYPTSFPTHKITQLVIYFQQQAQQRDSTNLHFTILSPIAPPGATTNANKTCNLRLTNEPESIGRVGSGLKGGGTQRTDPGGCAAGSGGGTDQGGAVGGGGGHEPAGVGRGTRGRRRWRAPPPSRPAAWSAWAARPPWPRRSRGRERGGRPVGRPDGELGAEPERLARGAEPFAFARRSGLACSASFVSEAPILNLQMAT
jgi:hypothetical protein